MLDFARERDVRASLGVIAETNEPVEPARAFPQEPSVTYVPSELEPPRPVERPLAEPDFVAPSEDRPAHEPVPDPFASAGAEVFRRAPPTEAEPPDPPEPVAPTRAEAKLQPVEGFCPKPRYPARAKARDQEGSVLCELDVDAEGRVATLRVLRSSGWPLLDRAVRRALVRWRFLGGPGKLRKEVVFELEDR